MEVGKGIERAPARLARAKARRAAHPIETIAAAAWWQSAPVQATCGAVIAFGAGLGLAIGLCLLATGLAHAHIRHTPPLLLSTAWSATAAITFVSSIAYLVVEPKKLPLLVVSAIPGSAMLCSVLLLLLQV